MLHACSRIVDHPKEVIVEINVNILIVLLNVAAAGRSTSLRVWLHKVPVQTRTTSSPPKPISKPISDSSRSRRSSCWSKMNRAKPKASSSISSKTNWWESMRIWVIALTMFLSQKVARGQFTRKLPKNLWRSLSVDVMGQYSPTGRLEVGKLIQCLEMKKMEKMA